jgi:hypothetical protein
MFVECFPVKSKAVMLLLLLQNIGSSIQSSAILNTWVQSFCSSSNTLLTAK